MADLIDLLDERWEYHEGFARFVCVWVDFSRSLVAIPLGGGFHVRRFDANMTVDKNTVAIARYAFDARTRSASMYYSDPRHFDMICEATRCLT